MSSPGTSHAQAHENKPAEHVMLPMPPEIAAPLSSDILNVTARATPARRAHYLPLIQRFSGERGLPASVADAVMRIESAYNPAAIGGVGEIGLMQIRSTTAAMLGFRGSNAELAEPETNIRYGIMYLAQAWRLAGGDLCRALMKYRAGHGEERMSALSVEYCRRARSHLAAIGAGIDLGSVSFADLQAAQPSTPFGRSARRVLPTRAFSEGGFVGGGIGGTPGGYIVKRQRKVARRSAERGSIT